MKKSSPDADPPEEPFPLNEFRGTFIRPKTNALYTIGLAVTAFAMLLLPALYIGLIVAVVWGVQFHLLHNTWIMGDGSQEGSMWLLIPYLGPAAAGAIFVIFMIKPLFMRSAKEPDPITLEPSQEPLLFAFVEKVCRLVEAPVPCQIRVDCGVNASAGLRDGLRSEDLILTIGLPLASGLNMREFAGVLAHEFGHFSQSAGMRMIYLIRSINLWWFFRFVCERGKFDFELDSIPKNINLCEAIVLLAARGFVWLTCRIFQGFMNVGHGISCFMLRQMEYDADGYESKLAGSDAFESTMRRLCVLNAAMQYAYRDVRQSWTSHRLPEDLPLFISRRAELLSTGLQQKLIASTAARKTGWFDTHPSAMDRVNAVRMLKEPGLFKLGIPAADLFADFGGLCKAATRHQYEKELKLAFTERNLVSIDEVLHGSAAIARIQKFYGAVNISLRPLLTEYDLPGNGANEVDREKWTLARKATSELREEAEMWSEKWYSIQVKLENATMAHSLSKAGLTVTPKEFGISKNATSAHEQEIAARFAIEEHTAALTEILANLDPFANALKQRVIFALSSALSVNSPTNENKHNWAKEMMRLLAAVAGEMLSLHEISTKLPALVALLKNCASVPDSSAMHKELSETRAELESLLARIQERLAPFTYPFPHPRGPLNLAEYARCEKAGGDDCHRTILNCNSHVERLFALHVRLVNEILAMAESAETMLDIDKPAAC